MKSTSVSVKIVKHGFQLSVKGKKYTHNYPHFIWKSFPGNLQKLLAQTAAVCFTNHLAVTDKAGLVYGFPPPPSYSLYLHGLIFSLCEVSQFVPNPLQAVKKAIDANLNLSFRGIPGSNLTEIPKRAAVQNRTAILFTFGKDSLLTFGLAKELNLDTELFFFDEPLSPYESSGRQDLRPQFEAQFKQKLNYLDLPLGKLRQNGGQMWGWDMIIFQYMLLLTPFLYRQKIRYMMIANEYNNNEININSDKMRIFYRFEQNSQWTLNSSHLFRQFGLPTDCVSLIEPLYEFTSTYILHHRYPLLSRFHLSCCADDPTDKFHRWCGLCSACARTYIFLKSLSLEPESIGMSEDILQGNKMKYFDIFKSMDKKITSWQSFMDSHCELLLAFYLATLREVKGDLIDLFKKIFGRKVAQNRDYLLHRVFKLHKSDSVPSVFRSQIQAIFTEEISTLRKEITGLFSTRV